MRSAVGDVVGAGAGKAGVRAHAALVAEAIDVRRGDTTIVRNFTWTIESGSVAWLVGPNGSGKSSLMRVLAGLDAPAAGRVVRLPGGGGGTDLGYFHPAMTLPPEAHAASFARLAAALVPGPKPLLPERGLGRKRSGSLSTGEQKRLLLGAILAREPSFLLLDEPYEHLSEEGRAELSAALVRLAQRSVVVVATNQDIPDAAIGSVVRMADVMPGVRS